MAQKLIPTIRFGSGQLRHAIGKRGYTHCSIWLSGTIGKGWGRKTERRPPDEVSCWMCRKNGGFLRPKPGMCLTATMPGVKVHIISDHKWKEVQRRLETPCHLNFTNAPKAVVTTRPYGDVTCGHCMRFAFQ